MRECTCWADRWCRDAFQGSSGKTGSREVFLCCVQDKTSRPCNSSSEVNTLNQQLRPPPRPQPPIPRLDVPYVSDEIAGETYAPGSSACISMSRVRGGA